MRTLYAAFDWYRPSPRAKLVAGAKENDPRSPSARVDKAVRDDLSSAGRRQNGVMKLKVASRRAGRAIVMPALIREKAPRGEFPF
jgi:hypothetical protein